MNGKTIKKKNIMKKFIFGIVLTVMVGSATTSCFNLDEEIFHQVDANLFYQDENSVKQAVAGIYATGALAYIEYFMYLQEFSADQIAWRTWFGGTWGYDEGEKTVLSTHTWSPESKIINDAWKGAWQTIGLSNLLLYDLENLDLEAMNMTPEKVASYAAEVRTLRAWAYYNLFEIWGGVLPLSLSAIPDEVPPPSVSTDFDEGCKLIYDFIMTELDETVAALPVNEVNRMNQAANRIMKARLLLNSEVFIGEAKYTECATLCQDIMDGDFGTYSIVGDHRQIYSPDNTNCPEVVMAFAFEFGADNLDGGWMRNMPFLPYNMDEYFQDGLLDQDTWNCVIVAPSYDNSGNVNSWGGTDNPVCFLDAPYGDKLGAVYERFDNRDVRKQNIVCKTDLTYTGMFLKGPMLSNFGTGAPLKADADREGQDLVYVDQVGTFQGINGIALQTVMSPRWGETNSGIRLVKYPMFPKSTGVDFRDTDEVEFRLTEVVYMLAECKMRAGDATGAKELVNSVRQRYFSAADWATVQDEPGRGFTAFDEDWMLSQWGLEFLCEGRRRRTDLRRFDKFTQGQWWFFGRATDDGFSYPAARDRKYEWFPIPASVLMVNKGLVQNPNY